MSARNLYEMAKIKQTKRDRLHQTREVKDLDECTFTPKINKSPRRTSEKRKEINENYFTTLSPIKTDLLLSSRARDLTPPSFSRPQHMVELQSTKSQKSFMTTKSGVEKSKSIFQDLVVREFNEMTQNVKGPLIYEDFETLMIKHGFAKIDQHQLL